MSLFGIRMKRSWADAHVAQLVERVLGKDEVISSILIMGSRLKHCIHDKINAQNQ